VALRLVESRLWRPAPRRLGRPPRDHDGLHRSIPSVAGRQRPFPSRARPSRVPWSSPHFVGRRRRRGGGIRRGGPVLRIGRLVVAPESQHRHRPAPRRGA